MREGEFADGAHVLRAKIDMASSNLNLRDPTLYRIRRTSHHRTGDRWCIYPLYDFTHCLSDSLEASRTRSCTLEFENHRPLYDWVLDALATPVIRSRSSSARAEPHVHRHEQAQAARVGDRRPRARLGRSRMPTISGFRRRGYTPEAIRDFCDSLGVAKRDGVVDMAMLRAQHPRRLEPAYAARDGSAASAQGRDRELSDDRVEELEAVKPEDPAAGTRRLPFTRELYIEREIS